MVRVRLTLAMGLAVVGGWGSVAKASHPAAPPGRTDETEAAIDRTVKTFMTEQQVPGLALGVVYQGRTIFAKGYGVTDLKTKEPVTADTVFPLASLGKPFLAMLVLRLAEEHKLSLQDPIGKYLTDLPAGWDQIPLIHLLDHTAGIPDHINSDKYKVTPDETISAEEIYKRIISMPLTFVFGQRYQYSNGGYALIARIVEKVTGAPYGDFMNSTILRPLHLTETRMLQHADMAKLPTGYVKGDKGPKESERWNIDWSYGAGQLGSSIADLARWDASLYSDVVLKSDTLRFITTDQKLTSGRPVGYAMGWNLGTYKGSPTISHSGRFWGFTSIFIRYAAYDLTLIVLANSDTCSPEAVARKVAGLLVPRFAPRILRPIRDDYPDLTNRHLAFVQSVVNDTVDPNLLNQAMRDAFLPKVRGLQGQLLAQFGAFTGFDPVERSANNGLFTSRYRLQQGEKEWLIGVVTNANGTIVGFSVEEP